MTANSISTSSPPRQVVIYKLYMTDGTMKEMHSPADMPDPMQIEKIEEPWIKATILTPDEYLGAIIKLMR